MTGNCDTSLLSSEKYRFLEPNWRSLPEKQKLRFLKTTLIRNKDHPTAFTVYILEANSMEELDKVVDRWYEFIDHWNSIPKSDRASMSFKEMAAEYASSI